MPFYTDLGRIFNALGGRHAEFNWLITDLEYMNCDGMELPPEFTCHFGSTTYEFPEIVWLSGERLSEIVGGFSLQFLWAVLSGFEPQIDIDPNNLEVHPFANGNSKLWRPGVGIQHPRASVEIICWDSSCTLLLSKDTDLSRRFREYFPGACDLDSYNRNLFID